MIPQWELPETVCNAFNYWPNIFTFFLPKTMRLFILKTKFIKKRKRDFVVFTFHPLAKYLLSHPRLV